MDPRPDKYKAILTSRYESYRMNITVIHIISIFLIIINYIFIQYSYAQIHSSVTIHSNVPSSSSLSIENDPLKASAVTECSSLALSTCHDIQPVSGTYSRTTSFSSPHHEVGGYKCEDLNFCDDILGFEAILNLHRQLDDDANGDIDVSESKEFLRDELKYEHGANDRQRAFHGNDKHINVAELWHTWKVSAVHNWTVEEVTQWLIDFVELPQYSESFHLYSINGMALPRLAVNQQLASKLGITNVIHRQKLSLKATDVVLFGVPKPGTLIKDLIMICLVLFASFVGYFSIRQNRKAQDHIRKMNRDIEALSSAEKQLEMMQDELNRTKQEHQTAYREKEHLQEKLKEREQILEMGVNHSGTNLRRLSYQDDYHVIELERNLSLALDELRRLENALRNKQWTPPRQAKELLQMTYEIEIKNYNAKKLRAEAQLREAREECDKLRKKRSSVFGAFRVAHGSSIDIVDATILQARTIMTELTKETHERIQRWKALEQLCGFDITTNPGYTSLERSLENSYNSLASQSNYSMLSHNHSSSTLKDADNCEYAATIRKNSLTDTDDGLTMLVSPQSGNNFYETSSFTTGLSTNNIRPQAIGIVGQRMEVLQRINGTGSDGVERHFDSISSISTVDVSNKNNINCCSFDNDDFPPSSSTSSSEFNGNSAVISEQSSNNLSSSSLSTIKEKKKRLLFGLVRRKNKADKKIID